MTCPKYGTNNVTRQTTPRLLCQVVKDRHNMSGNHGLRFYPRPGISNFSSPSPHRMPTLSAAQALQSLRSSPTRCIPTSLPLLDYALQNRQPQPEGSEPFFGGVSRGKVTEIYGPPGVGKTALCMQIAANALRAGENVVWVDASRPLPGVRLLQILQSDGSSSPSLSSAHPSPQDPLALLENLTHFSTPTLAHLLALFSDSTTTNPPQNTSLIVIDSFSTPFSTAFLRTVENGAAPKKPSVPKAASRKFPILNGLLGTFQKLAALRNIAIVLTSQCVTKLRPGISAALLPALSTTPWEQGLGSRVVIFRDWGWRGDGGEEVDEVRIAQVLKAEGSAASRVVPFAISESGLVPLAFPTPMPPPQFGINSHGNNEVPQNTPNMQSTPTLPTLPQKRKLDATDLEIPDSEDEDDEDYGWGEEDEEDIPVAPPQWQGSEDILIPLPGELETEDAEEEGPEFLDNAEDEVGEGRDDDGVEEVGDRVDEKVIEDSEDELAL
ncbi:P-loop containing nucleoside triphosphate hydrolase protein [Tricladium varicosporioides]|nr:P-loop containing nucleoside triphosphate hydrolase protein [Hymenoscyphus varicosporioides]